MKNTILYFSGTGNSLYSATKIAEALTDTDLIKVKAGTPSSEKIDAEIAGFVFPVYGGGIPEPMANMMRHIMISARYIFVVATYARISGTAVSTAEHILRHTGHTVHGKFSIQYPSGYIALEDAFSQEKTTRILAHAEDTLHTIIDLIADHAVVDTDAHKWYDTLYSTYLMPSLGKFLVTDNKFYATERCTGCETCRKLCPQDNIAMEQKRPRWQGHCIHCMACICWCPAKAIEYGRKTRTRTRYTHPHVALNEMIT